jgi:DNA-directed RNA polymerase specialized sigma24 family protein
MTRKQLENYQQIVIEIKLLKDDIRELDRNVVSDVVRGSYPESPYVAHSIRVSGLTDVGLSEIQTLSERLAELENSLFEISEFILNIPDLRTQRIFRLRIVKGLSWVQIAAKMNTTPDSVRMHYSRYLRRNTNN